MISADVRASPSSAMAFWSDHYARSENALGASLSHDGHPFQIIGVASPRFFGINVGENFDVAAVQDAIGVVNKEIPLEFRSLSQQVNDSILQERLLATLSSFFGGLAVLLAVIGLYGAISYLVTLRRIEFGIRGALGAQPVSILQLVMRDVAVVLLAGLAAGVALSLVTLQLLEKMLFGLAPHDAFTICVSIAVFSAVALLAGLVPARRAMRVDPMVALRYE